MITLKEEFEGRGEVKGFNFKQIAATPKAYIYEVTQIDSGEVLYEVFKHKVFKPENRVKYPSSKAFGIWAWTTSDIDKAIIRFVNLCSK